MLSSEELTAAFKAIAAAAALNRVRTNTNMPLFHAAGKDYGGHGKFGHQGLIVNYKGQLKVSSRADFILGDVIEDGMQSLFLNHPLMRDLRAGNIKVCGTCPLYSKCGGDRNVAFATSGSFLGPDPQCSITNTSA